MKICKARKTLKNAALVAKIGVDTAENEQKRKKGAKARKNQRNQKRCKEKNVELEKR